MEKEVFQAKEGLLLPQRAQAIAINGNGLGWKLLTHRPHDFQIPTGTEFERHLLATDLECLANSFQQLLDGPLLSNCRTQRDCDVGSAYELIERFAYSDGFQV